jgi:hypothetical protein
MGDLGQWHLDHLDGEVELDASAMQTFPDRFEYEAKRWHDAGDRVVVESVQRGWLASGPVYSTPINNVWTFDFAALTTAGCGAGVIAAMAARGGLSARRSA